MIPDTLFPDDATLTGKPVPCPAKASADDDRTKGAATHARNLLRRLERGPWTTTEKLSIRDFGQYPQKRLHEVRHVHLWPLRVGVRCDKLERGVCRYSIVPIEQDTAWRQEQRRKNGTDAV